MSRGFFLKDKNIIRADVDYVVYYFYHCCGNFIIAVTVSDIRKIMTDLKVWREEQGTQS